jgi:hypothetical protein
MMTNPKSRIQDLCSEALAATNPAQIEPILSELRSALHEKIQGEETWMSLCERAAVEQDPKKLLELVSEINRRFQSREQRLTGTSDGKQSAGEHSPTNHRGDSSGS